MNVHYDQRLGVIEHRVPKIATALQACVEQLPMSYRAVIGEDSSCTATLDNAR